MDRVGQEHRVAVDVGVDEAGDDVTVAAVEHACGVSSVKIPHRSDHRVEQADVGLVERRPSRRSQPFLRITSKFTKRLASRWG